MLKTGKGVLALIMSAVFAFGYAFPAGAEVTLEDILKRVEALEAENTALKAEVGALKGAQVSQAAEVADVKAKTLSVAAAAAPAAPLSAAGNFLKTKMDIELYGFVSGVAAWSDSDQGGTASMSNAPRENIAGVASDGQDINFTAQDTRLGLNFKAPDLEDGGKVSGKFEMDFAGGTASSTTSMSVYNPRLRLAYAQLDYAKWGVMAGQNWDFFAPLSVNLINAGVLYRAGNIGTRHPMVYVSNNWGEMLGGKFTSKFGAIDTDDTQQEESGVPVGAGYVGYETKVAGVATTLGVGGAYGRNVIAGATDADIWAVTAGLTLKFTDWLSLKTEGYNGAKLDDFQGGSATGVNGYKGVQSTGGFVELTLKPTKKVETNFGAGQDVTRDVQPSMSNSSVWDYNRTYYTNLKYSLSKDLLLGLEYQYFQTKYTDDVEGDANRLMSSLTLKF
ncbi:MAG: hypothetical protein HQL20_03440 [Candidatus Omnitrophica bacterium]|nr:hypothetical protein [Candidatus Omnitrophota bacterium]